MTLAISEILFVAAFFLATIILFGLIGGLIYEGEMENKNLLILINANGSYNSSDSDDDSTFEEFKKFATERFEKKAYLCIQLEEYAEEDGSDEDLNYKEECDTILEGMDYFEKKEILKKYD